MNCPNCRHDNPSTTRFCTNCGGVLVENTPDGRRRRVLRPWGMGHAPLTESPAMPEITAALTARAKHTRRPSSARFAGGTVVVAMGAMLLYPYARAIDAPQEADEPMTRTHVIPMAQAKTPEAHRLSVPEMHPLPQAFTFSMRFSESVTTPPRRENRARVRQKPEALPAPTVPAPVEPAREVAVHQPPALAVPPPVPSSPPVADRWQALQETLSRCSAADGVFRRAMCEQGARLAHCDGYWGAVEHCPAGRTEYGQ